MRTQGQVKQQLRQVIYRHLQKKLRALFKKKPITCGHNRKVPLVDGGHVRLCGFLHPNLGIPRHVPCDDRISGCTEMARECPMWGPRQPKADVKAQYHALIQSSDRGRIAAEYPDIAALMWVLDDPADIPSESEIAEMGDEDEEEPEKPGGLWGWFKKLGGG